MKKAKTTNEGAESPVGAVTGIVTSTSSKRGISKLATPTVLSIITAVLILIIGGVIYTVTRSDKPAGAKLISDTNLMNNALQNNDKTKALEYAKKALAKNPKDVDAILAVASIASEINPSEAKQYYKRALDAFKQQENPDATGKSATTYWAAASLAEDAGDIVQAKRYYQAVIEAANPADGYEQSIAKQSEDALKRLK